MAYRVPLPDQSTLLKLFSYDPETGSLTRLSNNHVIACRQTKVGRQLFYTHKIIWKMVYNEEPVIVDHRDTDSTNNKLSNLRPATHAQNTHNSKGHRGRTLPKNIVKRGRKYIVKMYGAPIARFSSLDEAVAKRNELLVMWQGEFACLI